MYNDYNFDYNFNWGQNPGYGTQEVDPELIFSVFGMFFAVMAIIGLLFYILRAVGLMGIAKRRGFPNSWLAWIPFANAYLFGKVADDISYRNGQIKAFRKILLSLEIAVSVGTAISLAVMMKPLMEILSAMITYRGQAWSLYYPQTQVDSMLFTIGAGAMIMMLVSVVAMVYVVFHYIALYRIYKEYSPNEAVIFLVLSILLSGIFEPISLLIIKNRTGASIANPPGQWVNGVFQYNMGYGYSGAQGNGQGYGYNPYAQQPGYNPYYQPQPPQQPPYGTGYNGAQQAPGQQAPQQPGQPQTPPQAPNPPYGNNQNPGQNS